MILGDELQDAPSSSPWRLVLLVLVGYFLFI
jgi:hypothetical protein